MVASFVLLKNTWKKNKTKQQQKSLEQQPVKQQLYGHLTPISHDMMMMMMMAI